MWVPVSGETGGVQQDVSGAEQFEFDGETLNTWHGGHVEEKGTIRLDPSRDPKEFDVTFQDGKNAGKTYLAIYTWDGANLKFCMAKQGHPRPTDFTTTPGDNRVLVVVKRQDR
jgi:uncharacterized protein (TIGR03067 family)